MSKPKNEKLREEYFREMAGKFNGTQEWLFDEVGDFWLNKMKEQREKMIETISEDITNYDEVYISEDVRKAINRMKFNLKSIIKNKE